MKPSVGRLKEYIEDDFDRLMLHIKKGQVKAGKYAHLVKVKEGKKIKGNCFFGKEDNDGKNE